MQPIKQFWKNSAIYGIGSIMVRAISFFLLPLYTNEFSQSETGYIFLVFTFIAFAQIVYSYGQDSSFLQFYKQDSIDMAIFVNGILVFKSKMNPNAVSSCSNLCNIIFAPGPPPILNVSNIL